MIYAFGDCELDLRRFEVRRAGSVVKVEPQVFDVLSLLVRERDRVVPKEEILDTVWGDRFVSESALTSRIKALRRAIGDDGTAQRMVATVHGRGYRFVGEVEEHPGSAPGSGVAVRTDGAPPPQQIRFCTTTDGVRLAFASMGDGPPLVKVANWLSHLDFDRESVVWRHWLVELARRFRLVRYDERGCGLSDWDVADLSFESWVGDLETVVDAAGLDRFPLLGISQGGPVAIEYAVRHPERVTRLVLLGTYAVGRRRRAVSDDERELVDMRTELVRLGWGRADPQYRMLFASRFIPDGSQEEWRAFDDLQTRSTSPYNAWRFVKEFGEIDVTATAPRVACPTLIACSRREPDGIFEQSRLLASLIPGAQLVPLDSANHLLPEYDPVWPQFLAALDAFLDVGR